MNTISKDINYEETLYKREALEYQLEHKDEFENGNEFLYGEITEFNNKLRSTKKLGVESLDWLVF